MKVSVLTPTIEGREEMLEECRMSVVAQTLPEREYEHLVFLDAARHGCSFSMNQLAGEAKGEYLLPLADDDLLLPPALEVLLAHADRGDIIYAQPAVWGWQSPHFFEEPPRIPSFALVPRELWLGLGGYDETAKREEDRKLWTKAMMQGVTFYRVDYPCWVYRFHGGNKSLNGGEAA